MKKRKKKVMIRLDEDIVKFLKDNGTNISGLCNDLLFYYIYFNTNKERPQQSIKLIQEEIIKKLSTEKVAERLVRKLSALLNAVNQAERKIDDLDVYLKTI
jgi:predicted Zn-dependent peptidase